MNVQVWIAKTAFVLGQNIGGLWSTKVQTVWKLKNKKCIYSQIRKKWFRFRGNFRTIWYHVSANGSPIRNLLAYENGIQIVELMKKHGAKAHDTVPFSRQNRKRMN